MNKLRNNISKLRFENNEMTQEQLDHAVGVTRQTIIAIEKDKYVPSLMLAMLIVRLFKKNVEEVFFIQEDE